MCGCATIAIFSVFHSFVILAKDSQLKANCNPAYYFGAPVQQLTPSQARWLALDKLHKENLSSCNINSLFDRLLSKPCPDLMTIPNSG
jgi:hypothetical protein